MVPADAPVSASRRAPWWTGAMAAILGAVRPGLMLLAAGLLGCEIYSTPPAAPCPGDRVATFSFSTQPDGGPATSGSTCPFASDPNQVAQSLSFTASLHASPDGGAALCRSSDHALPWLGTFQAGLLDVSVTDTGGGTPSCGCALLVVERVTGSVLFDGGAPAGFTGELVDSVAPADAAALDGGTADGGVCGCGLPCDVIYAPLVGAVAGAG